MTSWQLSIYPPDAPSGRWFRGPISEPNFCRALRFQALNEKSGKMIDNEHTKTRYHINRQLIPVIKSKSYLFFKYTKMSSPIQPEQNFDPQPDQNPEQNFEPLPEELITIQNTCIRELRTLFCYIKLILITSLTTAKPKF